MVQAMVWLKLHLAWNSHYKFKFYFCLRVHSLHRWWFFFLFVFSFVFRKVRDKPHESWTEVEPENNGGWGRRGARREGIIFFCLTLPGCINMIYKWKFHPKNCQLHRLKNYHNMEKKFTQPVLEISKEGKYFQICFLFNETFKYSMYK